MHTSVVCCVKSYLSYLLLESVAVVCLFAVCHSCTSRYLCYELKLSAAVRHITYKLLQGNSSSSSSSNNESNITINTTTA
jgi:hypothetical protein